jgi:TolA-binding protein
MNEEPKNLSPMEKAVLESWQEHEKRLNELERLLKQLTEQSENGSDSDRKSVEELKKRLSELEGGLQILSEQVERVETQLKNEAPVLKTLAGQLKALLALAKVNE